MDIASGKTHIIFDFDRTIATINVNWVNWHLGAGEIFKKYEPTFVKHLHGEKIYNLQNEMFKKYGTDLKSEIDKFTREFEAKEVKGVEPISKTIELIKDLHRKGECLYIWSSNDSVLVEKSLKELDIYHKFSFLVTRDNVDLLKPEISGFDKHFANLDKDLDKFLMIGDSDSDSSAASSCGIQYLDVKDIE
jgi:HAD superfamily hydrolase (TIGR01509 family)